MLNGDRSSETNAFNTCGPWTVINVYSNTPFLYTPDVKKDKASSLE